MKPRSATFEVLSKPAATSFSVDRELELCSKDGDKSISDEQQNEDKDNEDLDFDTITERDTLVASTVGGPRTRASTVVDSGNELGPSARATSKDNKKNSSFRDEARVPPGHPTTSSSFKKSPRKASRRSAVSWTHASYESQTEVCCHTHFNTGRRLAYIRYY